jgi:hypothetical protein
MQPGMQVLTLLAPIRCLFWCAQQSTLAVGQEPRLAFYSLDAQQAMAHKRSRTRHVSVSGKCAVPEPLWLRNGDGHHAGSAKLARIRARQEAKHMADAALHHVRSGQNPRASLA